MRNYKIHLIKHGKTDANFLGKYIGRTDLPLSEDGVREILNLKKDYVYPPADIIYTSPLLRCRATAELLYPDFDFLIEDELREMSFGEFEELRAEDLADNGEFVTWLADSYNNAPPGGESGAELLVRTTQALDRILGRMMREGIYSACVITHGGIIAMLLAAHAYPKGGMDEWQLHHGEGFTISVNPQLWLRDGVFEVETMLPAEKDSPEPISFAGGSSEYDSEYDVYNDYDPDSEGSFDF